jgi:hypothetical protein
VLGPGIGMELRVAARDHAERFPGDGQHDSKQSSLRAADTCRVVCLYSSGKMFGHRPILYGTVRDGTRGLSAGDQSLEHWGPRAPPFSWTVSSGYQWHPSPCNRCNRLIPSRKGHIQTCGESFWCIQRQLEFGQLFVSCRYLQRLCAL